MKKKTLLLLLVAIGLLAGCSTGTGGSSDGGTPAAVETNPVTDPVADPVPIVTEKYTKQSDGSYYFSVNDPTEVNSDGKTYFCCSTAPVGTGTFTYTVKLRKDSGAANGGFGVVFQRTKSDTFWIFNIDERGYYYLAKVVSGGVNEITPTPWMKSSALITGYGQTNEITIAYLGSTDYKIYANGKEVTSFTDSGYGAALKNGCFGLDTVIMPSETFPGTPLTVRYEVVSPSGTNMSEISCP